MERSGTDGFYLSVGFAAVVVGSVALMRGGDAGWSLLLVLLGLSLLALQWIIANHIEFEIAGVRHVLAAVAGTACLWAAAIYLTRGADDLPLLLPWRDGDSGHLRLFPGILACIAGAILLGCAIVRARPQRGVRRR